MYRLLIVDDEALIRRGLSQIIPWNELGYELVGAVSNAAEALKWFEETKIDVLLTDISMPEMNGLVLIEKAREHNSCLRSVVISGYSQFDYAWEAIQLKVENYILKPLDPDKIADIFKKLKESLDREMEERQKEHQLYEEYERMRDQHKDFYLPGELDPNLARLVLAIEQDKEDELVEAAEAVFAECRTFHTQNAGEYMGAILEKLLLYFRMEPMLLSQMQIFSEHAGCQEMQMECAFLEDVRQIQVWMKENSEALAIRVSYQARQYVNEHYRENNLSLRQVAELLHVSYGYLSTAFAKTFGENFKSYVGSVRVEKARELLLERKYKIYEIADLVGYGSSRYFTDAFKRKYGVSPADYINKGNKSSH